MFDLTGKKAIITGAAGDLGSAMAEALYENGADIAILDASERTKAVAQNIKAKREGQTFGIRVDLSKQQEIENAFKDAVEKLDGLDILLNCAGINIRYSAEDFDLEAWDKVLNINLRALFQMCQLAGNYMIPRHRGKIINIASMNSFIGGYNNAAYAASKGGVGQLTKTLSNEWAQYGICINAIAPGYMHTKMNNYYFTTEAGKTLQKTIMSRVPMGRWGEPDDLKGAAVFLASDEADFISGIVLPVDGGFLGR